MEVIGAEEVFVGEAVGLCVSELRDPKHWSALLRSTVGEAVVLIQLVVSVTEPDPE